MGSRHRKKTIHLPLEILEEKQKQFFKYWYILQAYADEGRSAHPSVIRKFFDCIIEYNYEAIDYTSAHNEIDQITEKIYVRLKKESEYDFKKDVKQANVIREDAFTGKKYPKYHIAKRSFYDMIQSTVRSIVLSTETDLNRKESVLVHAYSSMVNYLSVGRIKYKPYRLYVISALIADNLGFGLTEKKKPTNEQLFQAVKNILNRRVKKKALKQEG